jgi:vitamin B12/bleomycin/antimicrobial peptide transport system ATP-binding/permease protein
MTEPVTSLPIVDEAGAFRRFWQSASGFWRGTSRRTAWGLVALLIVVLVLELSVKYRINFWYRDFFDALEKKNGGELWREGLLFVPLVLSSIAIATTGVWARMTTERLWRGWLTVRLIDSWLKNDRYRQLNDVAGDHGNPEYRIAEDARIATEAPVDFAVGLLTSFLTVFIFADVLWTIGGTLGFPAFGQYVVVPGYLVMAVVAYAAMTTISVLVAGRRMVDVVKQTDHAEAELRREGSRLRENSEKTAIRGAGAEKGVALHKALERAIARWRDLCWQLIRTTVISHGNLLLAPFVGLVLCAPKYLADTMTLGEVVQAAAAFVAVQGAINWLVENYPRLASWTASIHRVSALLTALDRLDDTDSVAGVTVQSAAAPPVLEPVSQPL